MPEPRVLALDAGVTIAVARTSDGVKEVHLHGLSFASFRNGGLTLNLFGQTAQYLETRTDHLYVPAATKLTVEESDKASSTAGPWPVADIALAELAKGPSGSTEIKDRFMIEILQSYVQSGRTYRDRSGKVFRVSWSHEFPYRRPTADE